jgi:DNA-binding MarR family transcriptional regulator
MKKRVSKLIIDGQDFSNKKLLSKGLNIAQTQETTSRTYKVSDRKQTLPQFDILSALDRSDKAVSMNQLSKTLLVFNGNVTGVVNRLIQDGLISSTTPQQERRTYYISINKKGSQECTKMAETHAEWLEGMFKGLNTTETPEFLTLTQKLKSELAEE